MPTMEFFTARPVFEQERAAMGAVGAVGFATAGFLGLVSVLMPVPDSLNVRGVVALSVLGLVAGAFFFYIRDRIPLWVFHVASVGGIAIITASIDLNGDPAAINEIYYLYIAGFTFYYFAWYEAVAYSLLILVAYGWVEARIGGGSVEPTNLLILAGATVMLGSMLRFIGGRSRALVAELETQAMTDSLTGLLNRRGLQRLVDSEMERAGRTGREFSLLICDLDHFKSVNDHLGHMGGDMALERVAARLNAGRRSTDCVARVGGEEFAVLMPETGSERALAAAERIRERISDAFEGRPVALTMSIGIASYPRDGRSWEQLLDAADVALYAAKDAGRDRVVAYDGNPHLVTS